MEQTLFEPFTLLCAVTHCGRGYICRLTYYIKRPSAASNVFMLSEKN